MFSTGLVTFKNKVTHLVRHLAVLEVRVELEQVDLVDRAALERAHELGDADHALLLARASSSSRLGPFLSVDGKALEHDEKLLEVHCVRAVQARAELCEVRHERGTERRERRERDRGRV